MTLQTAIHFLFPPRCMGCGVETTTDFALCGACWRETSFITGLVCDHCGTPLPGEAHGETVLCDDCLMFQRPWAHGRAALVYDGNARKMVLALKHGDRLDMVRAMAGWMAEKARALDLTDTLVAPVPLHRWRYFHRKYNQSALLARCVARNLNLAYCPDLLRRTRATKPHKGLGHDERMANQLGAIAVSGAQRKKIAVKRVLLVDDVMTSGATLGACADACLSANAKEVIVLVLARVARDA